MKRQTQVLGVRNWYGDAFVSLQEEPLKVIDGFFSQYGAFVLSGCEVKANGSKYDIAPGMVVLEGPGANNATVKVVVPFAGITATALPVYLTLGYETETDVYNDGNVKPIANIYKAVATTVKPAGSYVQITQAGAMRFIDAIQDATHRFITDVERKSWEGKVDKVPGKGLSTNDYTDEDKQRLQGTALYDYIVDSDQTLAALDNNPDATNVLIKKGTYSTDKYITLHPNTKQIIGEPGNMIVSNGYHIVFRRAELPSSDEYFVKGINVTLKMSGIGFERLRNLSNCTCTLEGGGKGFSLCENVETCSVINTSGLSNLIAVERCTKVIRCTCNAKIRLSYLVFMCTATEYDQSYSGLIGAADYSCSDTLAGGWNKVKY